MVGDGRRMRQWITPRCPRALTFGGLGNRGPVADSLLCSRLHRRRRTVREWLRRGCVRRSNRRWQRRRPGRRWRLHSDAPADDSTTRVQARRQHHAGSSYRSGYGFQASARTTRHPSRLRHGRHDTPSRLRRASADESAGGPGPRRQAQMGECDAAGRELRHASVRHRHRDEASRPTARSPPGRTRQRRSRQLETDAVVGADSTANPKPEATTHREPPTIDLTPLVPQGVPTGPPITINNPLRELLPPDLDLQNPLVPQVLPAPLVAILTAAAPSTPMLGIGAPPADLAPMGMDIMQAPAPQQPSPTPSPRVEPLAPAPPPPASAMPENEPLAFRAGYSDYLRNAGLAQITAIAVPGAAAILLFTRGRRLHRLSTGQGRSRNQSGGDHSVPALT